jgi:hypothetical protein
VHRGRTGAVVNYTLTGDKGGNTWTHGELDPPRHGLAPLALGYALVTFVVVLVGLFA